MHRRVLTLAATLMLGWALSACSAVTSWTTQPSDPLLAEAGRTFELVRSYRAHGTITTRDKKGAFTLEFVAPDRYRLITENQQGQLTSEVVSVSNVLYARQDFKRWQLLDPASETGTLVKELIQQASMPNLAKTKAERVGTEVVDDTPCALYKYTLNEKQFLHCVTFSEAVLIKTETIQVNAVSSFMYGDFNHPIEIEPPFKGLWLP